MLRAVSTYVFIRQRLHPGLLDSLVRAGAEAVEIFAAKGHFNYHDRAHVMEIARWSRESGIPINSMHSPMFFDEQWGRDIMRPINVAEIERKRRIEAMDEIKRALEAAEHMPFRFLVQHMGNSNEEFDMHKFDAGMTSIEHLRAFGRPLGVTLLLENIPNELSTPERLNEFVKRAHFEDVGFCFDTGHAHIMSSVRQAFEQMRERIHSTHIHDDPGSEDNHLWPGDGGIDWKETMELLQSAPHVPPLLLEINGDNQPNIAKGVEEAFRKLAGATASVET